MCAESCNTLLIKEDANMNKSLHFKRKLPTHPTCDNCVHTFRKKGGHGIVVCIPHLKDMHGHNSSVCELYSMKSKKHGAP
ncbi:hypothetical protein GALL_197090 [mine drainage metagenome]|uniref:Uncharacterized protein n=1 Tax=mine drainage metagenome TaxID=410659 RepID=A0A1J5RPT4_9ZZZZ